MTADQIPYATPAMQPRGNELRGIELLEPEPRWKRFGYGIIALGLSIGFFFAVMCYWVPAHAGTDQNGYLVGGKMFAQTLTMRQSPVHPGTHTEFDPHQYIGQMWIGAGLGTPDERYYPKYPLGLPALYAIALWIGSIFGPTQGIVLVYLLNPIAMSLAVLACYLLGRRFAGSFGGLLAAIVFATSPVTLQLATNPNSHATAVCCATWGMYFLIGWWQFRGMWRAIIAGLLLGYAGTIRYSEGTLVLPLALVALFALRWKDWQTLTQAVALLVAWAVPIGLLLLYNRFAMGDVTGYDPTNESTGFSWAYAADNWETMLRQINTAGLAQVFPLALAGLAWMFWWNWRAASILAAWIVPCLLTYTFYYWAPDGTSIGYLRFFQTILPALAISFYWLMSRLSAWAMRHDDGGASTAITSTIVITSGLLATILFALLLEHAWLWKHDPADANLQGSKIAHYLQPAQPDPDTATVRDAKIEFNADRLGALAAGTAVALIALALTRGKAAVPAVGSGLFTGVVIAMHLTNALPAMETDQFSRLQLKMKSDAIAAVAPAGSVVICPDDAILKHIQFAGDYSLYSGDTFRREYIQNLPNIEAPDKPQGLDPGRRDTLFKRFKDLPQLSLDDEARRVIRDALVANRRVFFVVPMKPNDTMPRKMLRAMGLLSKERDKNSHMPDMVARICPPDRFSTDVVAVYPGYVPTLLTVKTNKPRGIKPDHPPDPTALRQPMQIIEVTIATSTTAKG